MFKGVGSRAAAFAIVGSAPMVRGDIATIVPVADTSLFQWTDDYNFGAQVDLPAGGVGWTGRR